MFNNFGNRRIKTFLYFMLIITIIGGLGLFIVTHDKADKMEILSRDAAAMYQITGDLDKTLQYVQNEAEKRSLDNINYEVKQDEKGTSINITSRLWPPY